MSMSINSVISSYTYNYQNKLRPRLDKNDDAAWDRKEVENYARDYSQATGKALDVDKLYEKFDSDGDGVFNATEYESIISADALGMDTLDRMRIEQQTTSTPPTSTETSSSTTAKPDADYLKKLIEDFTYQYSGKLTPKLDSDSNGVWGREELDEYAALYQKATGKELDVDKLMETYDSNGDGVLAYTEQESVKKDNALGTDDLLQLQASLNASDSSGTTSSSSNTQKVDRYDLNSFIANNTYSYGSNLRLSSKAIDSDSNGVWNREELTAYADAYQKVTGSKIDVDSIMEKYADGDGNISFKNQQTIQGNDLLGLGNLAKLQETARTEAEQEAAKARESIITKVDLSASKSKSNGIDSLSDWMESLNSTQKSALSRLTFMSEQNSYLISSMTGGNSAMHAFNDLVGQYNAAKMYSSVAGGQNWSNLSGNVMNALV